MTKWVLKLIIRYLRFRSRYVITSLPWKIQQRHKFSDVINYTFNEIFKNPGSEKVKVWNELILTDLANQRGKCINRWLRVLETLLTFTILKYRFFLKGKLTMLMLPAGNAFDYKITCKSIVMLDNVSEMSLWTVSKICWIPAIIDKKNNTIRNEREKWQEEIREKLERWRNRYRYRQQKRGERERDRKRPTQKKRQTDKERDRGKTLWQTEKEIERDR